jgi:hypothetical protein
MFGDQDNATFDIEKGPCYRFSIRSPQGDWEGCGDYHQSFKEILRLQGLTVPEGYLIDQEGREIKFNQEVSTVLKPDVIDEFQREDWDDHWDDAYEPSWNRIGEDYEQGTVSVSIIWGAKSID